nr:phospholipase-like protein [Tanacetum cinerariifolium]
MANLLELYTITKSNELKEMMVVLFESENQQDFILANNMNIVGETLVTRIRMRSQLIGKLDNCLCSIVAFESAKLLREINEADPPKARAFMTATIQIQIKYLTTRLSTLNDCVSRNYVPTYTLSSFVWAFKVRILESFEWSNCWWNKVVEAIPRVVGWSKKAIFKRSDYCALFCKESNPIFDLRPTLAVYQSEWWTSTIYFLKVYIPRTPIRKPDLFDAYLQKVLVRERNGGVVEKLEFSDEFCHLTGKFWDKLNHDFLELFESTICKSVRRPLDADTEEEFDETHDYILEEEFSMRLEDEERLLLEEERLIEEEKKDISRINSVIDNIWISVDLNIYLGQPGQLQCKFLWSTEVCVDRRFWESLVCLDPPRKGWLMDEDIDFWVDDMWHVRHMMLIRPWLAFTLFNYSFKMECHCVTIWNVVIGTSIHGTSYRLEVHANIIIHLKKGYFVVLFDKENVYDFVQGRLLEVVEIVNVFDKK